MFLELAPGLVLPIRMDRVGDAEPIGEIPVAHDHSLMRALQPSDAVGVCVPSSATDVTVSQYNGARAALTNGNVACWGRNEGGRFGVGGTTISYFSATYMLGFD